MSQDTKVAHHAPRYLAAAFVAVIIASNALTYGLGVVQVLGLTATAGTWTAGLAFAVRDHLQQTGGTRWVLSTVVAGAVLSATLSPSLALASGAAFLLSELADWAVYTPLRAKGRTRAALASNVVGAFVDTAVFLVIAGFPLNMLTTQVVVKVLASTVLVGGIRAVSSKPL